MKLSMWILKDYMEKYRPLASIESGKKVLRGVRILSGGNIYAPSTLQLVRGANYIDGADNKVLCVNGRDMIQLETENIDDVFNESMDCFDHYNAWEDRCIECIENGDGLQKLLEVSQPMFPNMLLISDPKMTILNYTKPELPLDYQLTDTQKNDLEYSERILTERKIPDAEARSIHSLHREQARREIHDNIIVESPVSEEYSCLIMIRNLVYRQNQWGVLAEICHFKEPDIAGMQLLDELGNFIEEYIRVNISKDQADRYLATRLERVFTEKHPEDLQALGIYLQDYGWKKDCRKRIYVIINTIDDEKCLEDLNYYLNNSLDSISIHLDDRVLLLSNLDHPEFSDTHRYLKSKLKQMNCAAAFSYTFDNITDLPLQREIAQTSLDQWLAAGKTDLFEDRLIDSAAYVFRHILDAAKSATGEVFVHPAVTKLRDYDLRHGTEFTETLYQFLVNDRNFAKTSQQMFLHRNTVQYRIEKLIELTELDLDNLEVRLHLLLSLYEG